VEGHGNNVSFNSQLCFSFIMVHNSLLELDKKAHAKSFYRHTDL